jgi:hypothetical protein
MRKSLVLAVAAMSTAGIAALVPTAANAGTTVNVNLTGGALSVTEPSAAATLSGSAAAGTVLTQSLGSSTVTDDRGTLAGWTVTAKTSGDLANAGNTHTISLGTAIAGGPLNMATGAVTANGTSLLTGVGAGAGGSLNPSAAITVATGASLAGGGSYSYNPTLTFTVPPNTFADNYSTVVTQTVS